MNRPRRCAGEDRAAFIKKTGHPVEHRTRENVMFLETVDSVFRHRSTFGEVIPNDGIAWSTTGGIRP